MEDVSVVEGGQSLATMGSGRGSHEDTGPCDVRSRTSRRPDEVECLFFVLQVPQITGTRGCHPIPVLSFAPDRPEFQV